MIPDVIAHYRITAKIGEGGMGAVYRATDTKLGRDVAIKVIPEAFARDAERMARFTREAHVLASLNHPHIAAIYGVEEHALVMELVEGQDLSETLGRGQAPRAINTADALDIARQIVEALEYAHDHGIIHRDLKPANVKVTPEGQVKLLDFGLAKALADDLSDTGLANSPTLTGQATRAGVILGTAAYMSPEQAKGKVVDRRADIWAFGVVLYEMLTGTRGFTGESVVETMAAVMTRELDWTRLPADTPMPVRRLLRRCLEKDPKRRLRDIGEARIALDEPEISPAEVASSPPAATPSSRWISVAWITAAALAVALVWLTVLLLREKPADVPQVSSTILPPDQVAFNFSDDYQFGPPAISPDGRRLVFSAKGADGRIRLWVRALEGPTTELKGTDGGTYPFWSFDSQNIGFFAGGRLNKIAADGGNITQLAYVTSGQARGGTWSQDNLILFAPGYFTPILRVSAEGGGTSAVTKLDPTRRETTNRFPWFLPDGRHFLYTAQDTAAFYNRSTIRMGSLDSNESPVVAEADSNAVYSQGYLLYILANTNTLVARPFDLKTLKPSGEPRTLVAGVRTVNITSCGVFSASTNGSLIYQAGAAPIETKLAWAARDVALPTPLEDSKVSRIGSVHFSPDRKYASTNIQSATGQGSDIWIYDVTQGTLTPFTSSAGVKRDAIWSPNGQVPQRLVFDASGNTLPRRQDLYRRPFDKSKPEELLYADGVDKRPTSFSPDGKDLLYTSGSAATGYDIFVLPDPLGPLGQRKPVAFKADPRFNETNAQFSPNGRWVAYQSADTGRNEVMVAPFPGPGQETKISTAGGSLPRWSPNGHQIFYIAPDRRLMAVAVADKGSIMERQQRPTPFNGVPQSSAVSFVYDVSDDGRLLMVLPAEQSAAEPLTLLQNWMTGLGKR